MRNIWIDSLFDWYTISPTIISLYPTFLCIISWWCLNALNLCRLVGGDLHYPIQMFISISKIIFSGRPPSFLSSTPPLRPLLCILPSVWGPLLYMLDFWFPTLISIDLCLFHHFLLILEEPGTILVLTNVLASAPSAFFTIPISSFLYDLPKEKINGVGVGGKQVNLMVGICQTLGVCNYYIPPSPLIFSQILGGVTLHSWHRVFRNSQGCIRESRTLSRRWWYVLVHSNQWPDFTIHSHKGGNYTALMMTLSEDNVTTMGRMIFPPPAWRPFLRLLFIENYLLVVVSWAYVYGLKVKLEK